MVLTAKKDSGEPEHIQDIEKNMEGEVKFYVMFSGSAILKNGGLEQSSDRIQNKTHKNKTCNIFSILLIITNRNYSKTIID